VLLLLIVVPLVVAGGTSLLLVRREAAAGAGSATKHAPRAAGFGRGGQPVPLESSSEPGLSSLLEPDYVRSGWVRVLRVVILALILTLAAAAIAVGIFELLRLAGQAIKDFVIGG
jgi:hypothetical protein